MECRPLRVRLQQRPVVSWSEPPCPPTFVLHRATHGVRSGARSRDAWGTARCTLCRPLGRGPADISVFPIILIATLLLPRLEAAQASVHLQPMDAVHRDLDRLAAWGLIDTILVGQRPYSRAQAARLTAGAVRGDELGSATPPRSPQPLTGHSRGSPSGSRLSSSPWESSRSGPATGLSSGRHGWTSPGPTARPATCHRVGSARALPG